MFLLNPLVVSAYDIGDPDWYRYEASEVEFFDNGTYTYSSEPDRPESLDSDVACFGALPSRSCVLERAIHANGSITYDGPPSSFIDHEYNYVYIWEEGFFRPVTEEGQNGTVRYGLQSVPREEALGYIATPLSRTNRGVRTAIETGTYETSDELPGAHELVQAGDRYYVVYPAAYHEDRGDWGSERSPAVVVLQWLLGIIGAFLVLRGQRHRVERQ
ncbi:hypothetical protein C486_08790 [Natrinema gari JCM 14663]|uniref:Uncharacterized protein n=2 Tax=Natrinema gari TaxID=419186 RepID=L9Z5M0_9EURY|nr:hypothetical protein C486_08790 [Natrinema gari JCM 14663]